MWGDCDSVVMDKVQADLSELQKQGEETSSTIKTLDAMLKRLDGWMPQVDTTIRSIQQSLEVVGARVAALEAAPTVPLVNTPRPGWQGEEQGNQGNGPAASHALAPVLDKGMRATPPTPVHFDLGENSEAFANSTPFGSRQGHNRSAHPKLSSLVLMEITRNGGKQSVRNTSICMMLITRLGPVLPLCTSEGIAAL